MRGELGLELRARRHGGLRAVAARRKRGGSGGEARRLAQPAAFDESDRQGARHRVAGAGRVDRVHVVQRQENLLVPRRRMSLAIPPTLTMSAPRVTPAAASLDR